MRNKYIVLRFGKVFWSKTFFHSTPKIRLLKGRSGAKVFMSAFHKAKSNLATLCQNCHQQIHKATWLLRKQHSKFASVVGFCRSITPLYSICLSNKNAEAVKFLEILKKLVFLQLQNNFFVKEKKIFFIKKTFLQDTNYSCASIFIIHTFILYIFNSLLYLLCYALNEVIDVIHFLLHAV